ncbi:GTP-binding protein [Plakobranchus ocellatus]|uniref:GTP-binding protein n=1 Tax=Plakobranchus ocellatus TaxID=259542 RepID=A0AAV4E2Y3_9GAST|nr:GTP-binding protein [Plakobranchus ocellatus]
MAQQGVANKSIFQFWTCMNKANKIDIVGRQPKFWATMCRKFNSASIADNQRPSTCRRKLLCFNKSIKRISALSHQLYLRQFSASSGLRSNDQDLTSEERDEKEYAAFLRELSCIPGMGHRVLVIQPDIKTGPRRYVTTSKELKLEETCALVRSLNNWKVVEKRIVRTDRDKKSRVFGSHNFKALAEDIRAKSTITAVVVGIDRLTGLQVSRLQTAWGLPVFDRYTLVLQIFKEHAQSEEARLQVALAEVPYVRSRLSLIRGGFDAGTTTFIGGSTSLDSDKRRFLLQRREVTLKKQLEKFHKSRQEKRLLRVKQNMPTVAVVGYTNAGKTTLIKALTHDDTMTPENRLFATLDVSTHKGQLASLLKVTFIDTIGFISDMPITLLDAFRATLEDALMADLVVHVRDTSHPDFKLQVVSVHRMLSKILNENMMRNILEVNNKVDLLSEKQREDLDADVVQVSAATSQGLAELGSRIEANLLASTSHSEKTFRIPNNGIILKWLYNEAAVKSVHTDPQDSQRLIVRVIISKAAYGKFQARFHQKQ